MKSGQNTTSPDLLARELDLRAREFLVATARTRTTSRELPPVRAASVGLVQAWEAWAKVLARRDGERYERWHLRPDRAYGPPGAGSAAMELLVEAMRINNPQFLRTMTQDEVQRPVLLASAAALYQVRPHAVIEPTAALQTWLAQTDIGEDVPASLFRLPVPAVFLRFGPQMAAAVDPTLWSTLDRPCTTTGIYIFETCVDERRDIVFLAVGSAPGNPQDLPYALQLCFTDERDSLVDHALDAAPRDGNAATAVAMVQMCTKVLLYLQTPGAIRTDELRRDETAARLARAGGKKVSKLERRLASRYNRIIVGPTQAIQYGSGEVAPHWRRGHLRMQAHGPQFSLRKLIFIAPTLIRADQLGASASGNH